MDKEHIHSAQKDMICAQAAAIVKDGDCVYVDSGTTPSYLIPYIAGKNIKLVTSSIYALRKLPASFPGELFLIGGKYDMRYDMSVGYLTTEHIRKFHFDHAFFSASGVELDSQEVLAIDFTISEVKSTVLQRSRSSHLLIDDSKLSIRALCTWAVLSDFRMYTSMPLSPCGKWSCRSISSFVNRTHCSSFFLRCHTVVKQLRHDCFHNV